jgi:hypothetical protein
MSLDVDCVADIRRQPFVVKLTEAASGGRAGALYFPLTCSLQLLARPAPFRNGRAVLTSSGARPIS